MSGSQTREDWLLWMIADSALPTGGFVASAGLEAAVQAGFVRQSSDGASLRSFVQSSIHTYVHSSVPFVSASWRRLVGSRTDALAEQVADDLRAYDQQYDALTGTNHVARRASRAQGAAFLTLLSRGFPHSPHQDIAARFKTEVRAGRSPGHLPICFAIVCSSLGISLERTEHLYIFLFARSILSAAIRLNLVGPYQGQQLLSSIQSDVEKAFRAVETGTAVSVGEACQTSPVADILQGMHDRLYSRMFNS